MEDGSDLEREFHRLIDPIGDEAHGFPQLSRVRDFFKENHRFRDTKARLMFLRGVALRPAVLWEDCKSQVWSSEADAQGSKFCFLQGDLLSTTLVQALGKARSDNPHSLWIALTPTCDIVRAEYIRVGKVHEVRSEFRSGTKEQQQLYNLLRMAAEFHRTRYFALPAMDDDSGDLTGYLAELTVPYYLTRKDAAFAAPISSLTNVGWDLLNMVLRETETRANLSEERVLRATFSAEASA